MGSIMTENVSAEKNVFVMVDSIFSHHGRSKGGNQIVS